MCTTYGQISTKIFNVYQEMMVLKVKRSSKGQNSRKIENFEQISKYLLVLMLCNLHIQRNHNDQLQGRNSRILNNNGLGYFHHILTHFHPLKEIQSHTYDLNELFH